MPLAYTLSRKEFRFRRPLMAIFVFTMYFSGGLIPSSSADAEAPLMNTVWVMMIPTAVNVYNLIIARSFMDNLPPELYEASQLDGCSHFTYFLQSGAAVVKGSHLRFCSYTILYSTGTTIFLV